MNVHRKAIGAVGAEHFAHLELDRVKRRIDAVMVDWVIDPAVDANHDPDLAANIGWRSRIPVEVRGFHPHAIADPKRGRGLSHSAAPFCRRASRSVGLNASAVPIRLSRVTNVASSSSLQLSVPAGRRGSTIHRMSDVLSCTRTAIFVGTCRSNICPSVPRGSRTIFWRYSSLLYHQGVSPRRS